MYCIHPMPMVDVFNKKRVIEKGISCCQIGTQKIFMEYHEMSGATVKTPLFALEIVT